MHRRRVRGNQPLRAKEYHSVLFVPFFVAVILVVAVGLLARFAPLGQRPPHLSLPGLVSRCGQLSRSDRTPLRTLAAIHDTGSCGGRRSLTLLVLLSHSSI